MHPRLALKLLRFFAAGTLAATEVQSLAADAWADGWGRNSELANRLAKAGASGSHKGNINRDVFRAAELSGLMQSTAQPYDFLVPGPNGAQVKLTAFLPHELYYSLVEAQGIQQFCLDADALAAPTGLGALLRAWGTHPDVTVQHDLSGVAAFGMHCDGVQYTTSMRAGGAKSIYVGSFNIVSGRTPAIRGKRHLFFVLSKRKLCDCGCSGFHTFQAIFAVFAWSLHQLMLGRAPSCRHDGGAWTADDTKHRMPSGTQLPPAALLQIRGDWEWYTQGFRFRSAGGDPFCWMCNASKSGALLYTDFRPEAAHRQTRIRHHDYLQSCAAAGVQPSAIFRCPGMSLELIAVDSMHSGDLGAFADALGSLFWLEITCKRWHANKSIGLKSLNRDLDQFFFANRSPSSTSNLQMSQIRGESPGYPTLKAKAAQTRNLADFGLLLARRHQHGDALRPGFAFRMGHRLEPQTAAHQDLVQQLFTGMVNYHQACAGVPFDAARCKAGMYQVLQSHKLLHDMWREGLTVQQCRPLPWHLRPKCHALQHLVEDQLDLWGSPAASWCYGDEDFVGCIKRVAMSSKHPATLEQRVSEKCMLLSGIDSYLLANPELADVVI